jgi:hypothetical protein
MTNASGWLPRCATDPRRRTGTSSYPLTAAQINDAFATLKTGVTVEGDKWQVGVSNQDEAEQVKKILGGDIK